MTPTKILIGQIVMVFVVVLLGIWLATEWAAIHLSFQPELGAPWASLGGLPLYRPWSVFPWWYHFDAYAPQVFARAGAIAGASGFVACGAAIAGSLWRARQSRHVTTYGSAHWATLREMDAAGLFCDRGVFLGKFGRRYLRHDGPEHVMAFAPTRSGKGVGLVVPTLLGWSGSAIIHDIKGENWQLTAGWRSRFSYCLLFNPTDAPVGALQSAAGSSARCRRGPRRPEYRRHPGRSGRRARPAQSLGENQPLAPGRRDPACPLCRGGQDAGAGRNFPVRSATAVRLNAARHDDDQPYRHRRSTAGPSGCRFIRARTSQQE